MPPKIDLDILGTTGLRQSGGFVDEEFLRTLRGRKAAQTYIEMRDNSPIIGAMLYAIESLLSQVEWRIEPANGTSEAEAEADFVRGCMNDMSMTFDDFVSEVVSFIPFGWSYFETLYKIRRGPDAKDPRMRSAHSDGKVGWSGLELRAQETLDRWVFGDHGEILGMIQLDMYASKGPVLIPIDKALLFRTKSHKNNPEGKSLLRPAVIAYHYIKRIQEYEAIGIERDLAGLPVFEVPLELLDPDAPESLKALRRQFEAMIQQIRVDERMGAIVPSEKTRDGMDSGYKFKLLSSGSRKQIDADKVIKRYESRMAMTLLAQFILLGQNAGQGSSFALAASSTELFSVALGSLMEQITAVFNKFAIRKLQELNNKPIELDPKLVHGDLETPALGELSAYVAALSSAGLITGTPAVKNKLLEVASLPVPTEEERAEIEAQQSQQQEMEEKVTQLEGELAAAQTPTEPEPEENEDDEDDDEDDEE